jgi:cardiolipin synthase A/B
VTLRELAQHVPHVVSWLVSHHVVSYVVAGLSVLFISSILRQPRPTGSTLAWLLVIVLIPYVGMPLYLMLGGRKFRRRRSSKVPLAPLPPTSGPSVGPFRLAQLGVPTSATSTRWLTDGVSAYRQFLEEIRAAKKSIRVTTFVVGDDETGRSLLDALASRAKEGVEVHLLLDDLLAAQAPRSKLGLLRDCGGRVARFMPLVHVPFRGQANLRNHRKMALFDGQRAIIGGMNWATEYMGPAPREGRWRDLSLSLTGEVASELDAVFRADWQFASGEALGAARDAPLPPQATAIALRVVPSGPDAASDPIYDALLTAIFRAERRFWVATPYFVPDESLIKALALAVRRGVDVRVVVPAVSNHRLADLGAAPSLRQLRDEGATIHRMGGMLHAKAVLVDEAVAVVGSANFDMRSLFLDYEIALFLTDPSDVKQLTSWFEDCLRLPAVPASDPGWLRSQLEGMVRLLAPLL